MQPSSVLQQRLRKQSGKVVNLAPHRMGVAAARQTPNTATVAVDNLSKVGRRTPQNVLRQAVIR